MSLPVSYRINLMSGQFSNWGPRIPENPTELQKTGLVNNKDDVMELTFSLRSCRTLRERLCPTAQMQISCYLPVDIRSAGTGTLCRYVRSLPERHADQRFWSLVPDKSDPTGNKDIFKVFCFWVWLDLMKSSWNSFNSSFADLKVIYEDTCSYFLLLCLGLPLPFSDPFRSAGFCYSTVPAQFISTQSFTSCCLLPWQWEANCVL